MLDQNTTTIITTAITVIGTLGGVILGVVLSNRYVANQEKAKRNTTIIEEIYTLIIKIDNQIREVIYAKDFANIQDIMTNLQRATTLTNLYLPSVREDHKNYDKNVFIVMDILRGMNGSATEKQPDSSGLFEMKEYDNYEDCGAKLMKSLEKLVK